ncbi:HSP20 family protein [Aquimarina sp. MAR_2010_214]|uniref:hypothetical protein n=1 Tax=Aquimarina sp. MAR_2010_214 TaxID=1250026 RepID=UPI000CB757EC|nr:hypothetical protein [Aquimarina sp. MAR_2010_214]PKV52383.1 HSP20 family protein [Aquimarina sp. MAR_2010_214]
MSLVKFKRRPLRNLIASDFFDNDDFFNNRLWNKKMEEPALNVKETMMPLRLNWPLLGSLRKVLK